MLTTFKRLFSREGKPASRQRRGRPQGARALEKAQEQDIDTFLEAVTQADAKGHSPWVLRDQNTLETLRRALEFTVHRGLWLQQENGQVAHWQGQLLSLRHGDGPPLGMVLACRTDDEAAWQIRFFFISREWKGSGHGTRLLRALRVTLSGVPLQTRLPLACQSAVDSLETAGFTRQHVDALEVASFEAPAKWDE
ncbi:GNAT family N-acetyltransferase [Halomonas sp. HNIBRBA4712]|uniref:GNAT family N-acetyltransferase n=1 Tax=Halomonas sp. HNIBRBA4712 TaxID=3373087 RepID=UPI0037475BF0